MSDLSFLKSIIDAAAEPYANALTLSAGNFSYSFYEQFNNHYKGRLLKYHKREDCEDSTRIEFLIIFNDSLDILDKIKKYGELLEITNNLDNWCDQDIDTFIDWINTTEREDFGGVSFGTGTLLDKTKTTTINSDNNSYKDKEGEEESETIKDVVDYSLPINQYQKNLFDDENKTESVSVAKNKRDLDNKRFNVRKNKKEITNLAKDARDYANEEFPRLRNKLLNRFKPLFIWNPY